MVVSDHDPTVSFLSRWPRFGSAFVKEFPNQAVLPCLPTSGLDPISAGEFDHLIKTLQRTLGLTVFMVTHDLDSLHTVCDRIAVLAEGKIIAAGPMSVMLASEHPWLKAYFRGEIARISRN